MSDTVELERIMVRFFADAAPLIDSMKQAKQATENYGTATDRVSQLENAAQTTKERRAKAVSDLNKLMDEGTLSVRAYEKELNRIQGANLSERMAGGIQQFTSVATRGIGAVRDSVDLLRGKFDTIGEAADKVAGVAQLIPGPWGQAISSVISIVGKLVDFINRDLIAAQRKAKEEFMAVATGARTVEQAMRHIGTSTISEGMDRIVRDIQNIQQLGRLGGAVQAVREGGGGSLAFGAALGQGQGTEQEASARGADWIRNQIERRTQMTQELLRNPQLTQLRRQLAVEEIGGGLMDRPREMEMHVIRRRQMMAMHRPTRGPEEAAAAEALLRTETQRLAIAEFQRRTGTQLIEGSAEYNRLQQQALASAEAMLVVRRRMQSQRLEEELAHATTQHIQKMREAADQTVRTQAQVAGATTLQVKALEEQQKIERELLSLQERGASGRQLGERREQLEAAAAQHMLNAALQAGFHTTQQMRDPTEIYAERLRDLREQLGLGVISLETFARATNAAGHTLNQANPEIQAWNRNVQAGEAILHRFRDPAEQLREDILHLQQVWANDPTQREAVVDAIGRLTDQYNRLHQAMLGVQGMATRGADTWRLMRAQLMSFNQPQVQLPARPEDVAGFQQRINAERGGPMGPGEQTVREQQQVAQRQQEFAAFAEFYQRGQREAEEREEAGAVPEEGGGRVQQILQLQQQAQAARAEAEMQQRRREMLDRAIERTGGGPNLEAQRQQALQAQVLAQDRAAELVRQSQEQSQALQRILERLESGEVALVNVDW